MTIVERLRERGLKHVAHAPLCYEAADEIERLAAQVVVLREREAKVLEERFVLFGVTQDSQTILPPKDSDGQVREGVKLYARLAAERREEK